MFVFQGHPVLAALTHLCDKTDPSVSYNPRGGARNHDRFPVTVCKCSIMTHYAVCDLCPFPYGLEYAFFSLFILSPNAFINEAKSCYIHSFYS